MKWLSHEPPVLAERQHDGSWQDLANGPGFSHRETEAAGLVFQHYAYTTTAQVAFKECYYGYSGATDAWRKLQARQDFPIFLKEALPWVTDETTVNTVEACGIIPLAQPDAATGQWKFANPEAAAKPSTPSTIVVDLVFFQLSNTGIGRVWLEFLKCWSGTAIASRLCLLDRGGTAPQLPGIRYRRIPRMDPSRMGEDSLMLQAICEELHASLFVSTYYSSPTCTPTVSLVYDMIPELLGLADGDWQWSRKKMDLLHSGHFACISHSTALDLQRLHPEIPASRISIIPLAAPPEYRPPTPAELEAFRTRHDLPGDYIMLAGERIGIHVNTQGYKNAALAFKAWSLLPEAEQRSLTILCAGGKPALEEELRILAPGAAVRLIRFSDEELATALGGAVALIYPSLYEGFGLPVIEAMACGCPVITCRRASLTEVAGDAACFVDPWDAAGTAAAIRQLRDDREVRARHIALGKAQAARFSYPNTADSLASLLTRCADHPLAPSGGGAVWDLMASLQSGKEDSDLLVRELRQRITTEKAALKAAHAKIKSLREKAGGLQTRLARKNGMPLKKIWNFLRRIKRS